MLIQQEPQSYLPEPTIPTRGKYANRSRTRLLSPVVVSKHAGTTAGSKLSQVSITPKESFLPALHNKTHFKAATALMMQYQKNSSLHYEPADFNRKLGNSPLFEDQIPEVKPKRRHPVMASSLAGVDEFEEFDNPDSFVVMNGYTLTKPSRDETRKLLSRTGLLQDGSKLLLSDSKHSKPDIPRPP